MINSDIKIHRGNIVFTKNKDTFELYERGYLIVNGTRIIATTEILPDEFNIYPVIDHGNKIVIPAFNDLHIHAPQFRNRALCLDYTLMEWLFECVFREEEKFKDLEYAKRVYSQVIEKLWEFGSLRSIIYTTIHKDSTMLMFDMLMKSGLGGFVGKVNMDINVPEFLRENTGQSIEDTKELILKYKDKSDLVKPIIAPRFVPSCSRELMRGLGLLAEEYNVPVTSHLSEDLEEIKIVENMYPNFPTYGSIYRYFGLFGQTPTVMAHCIYSSDSEQRLIKDSGVLVAHCPTSNCNLASGMMPAREYLNKGLKIGLGTDIGGGGFVSMFSVMSYTMAVSKMVSLFRNREITPLRSSEIFYLATKGSGEFFGKVGSFEPGYDFDALIVDDSNLLENDYTLGERIERLIHLGSSNNIVERYVRGKKIERPKFD